MSAASVRRLEPEGGILSNVVTAGGFLTCVSMADDRTLDIGGQTRQALAYVDHCLKAGGSSRGHLVSVVIWLADIREREAMNAVWEDWLGDAGRPARACIEAKLADPRYRIEIVAIAAVSGDA
jgi:enamine deaminase RidA (YjgF/YER057c/UK114 family)